MEKFEGVSNTLYVPLVARIAISKKFPEYFYDAKALELEKMLPEGVSKGSSDYSNLASTARYYNMDEMVQTYAREKEKCNVVYLGAGLETAYDRMKDVLENVNWVEVDLPEVIQAREKVFGTREKEILVPGDMFQMEWVDKVDISLPTLLVISGVFQYFHKKEVVAFIKNCKKIFEKAEMIFDATNSDGLKFTNWFIKRTGNATALMYFAVDDGKEFAKECETTLLEERTFFTDAIAMVGKKVGFVTRISMKVANDKKRVMIYRVKL
ncbi:MAG: class I SAM-dependent methyltransferase [Lachnospiraceae bacterium]|nr:class I SAM-dependent methyltransferase [Lachnospiraceae bacterium]